MKNQVLKFYTTYKIFIFPIIIIFCSLILIVFVIYPQIVKLIRNQKDLGALMNKSQFLSTKVLALDNLDGGDLSKKVGLSLSSYPSDKDFGYVIGIVQNISAQSGYNVVSISLGESAKGNQSYAVKMQLIGSVSLLPILISNIENSNRLMRVSSVETTSRDSASVNVSLSLDVLYSALPSTFGTEDSPLPELAQKDEELLSKLAKATPVISNQVNLSIVINV